MGKPASMAQRDKATRSNAPSRVSDVVERADPRAFGPEPDEIYGVVSVLYHALQGSVAYDQYVTDAEKAGDEELVRFFRACRNDEHARARRAKTLLAARLADSEAYTDEPVPVRAPGVGEAAEGEDDEPLARDEGSLDADDD